MSDRNDAIPRNDNVSDFSFDFIKHKHTFNKIFFSNDNFIIKRNTPEYDDFWSFLVKFQTFHSQKAKRKADGHITTNQSMSEKFKLPLHCDANYKINFELRIKNVDIFLQKGRLIDSHTDPEVNCFQVKQFRTILLYYIDFINKQKFNKLIKIKQAQENLPIFAHKQDILDAVGQHQIVLIAGDTGCGKSTQVPQYLLKNGYTNIACTQPRRLACISLSNRVAYETLKEFGSEVAYQIRFEKTKTQATRILFLTEGLLLRQMSSDSLLSQFNVIIIDEVHERHMQTDFLLGVLKCLLHSRPDLKLILMSATINIELFQSFFNGCPIVKVPGRLYPIEVEYCPNETARMSNKAERLDPSPYLNIVQRIDAKYPQSERGDLLIFLSGMQEIMSVVEAVKMYAEINKRWIVLPLHSSLSIDEQDKVFDLPPDGVRKCIVSTNIAETSVTIDGVRFIIDSGKVKEMNLDPKYKVQKLKEFWISRASAEQRKGRAGRTGPGICYRLYSQSDLDEFQEFSTPEIQRVLIDTILLQLMALGLPDPRRFPFIESPSVENIENSVTFLKEHNALDMNEKLTAIGQMLSWLPVSVHIGKMLIMGSLFKMIDPVLSLAAAMTVQSPFTSHMHISHEAVTARKSLESEHGDPFTLLNAFDEWVQVKADGYSTRKWCKRRGLEEQRFYEMTKLKAQFKRILQDHKLLELIEETQAYTAEERRRRHGDRKRLRDLKREERIKSRKTKRLKLDQNEIESADMDDHLEDSFSGEKDIKDLEFRLTNDLNKLQETANQSRNFTLRDINLLKVILCSGLYPQVAIGDENNTFKPDSEQVFHTKNKPFLLLHPTSVFTYHPELIQSKKSSRTYENVSADLQGKLSNTHELLAFVTLLETNKPYVVNVMRVPALQAATLFSNSIDTNSTCTRLICDGWLEFRFMNSQDGEQVISSVIRLRHTWQELINSRLSADNVSSAKTYEEQLALKLTEYLQSDVSYTVRQLLPAELEHIYVGPLSDDDSKTSNFMKSMKGQPDPIKGGIRYNEYLVFNCLYADNIASAWGEYSVHLQKHWTCPHCHQDMIVTAMERIDHESLCQQNASEDADEKVDENIDNRNPLKRSYFCPSCDRQLSLTSTEIIKHKNYHFNSITS